MQRQNMLMRSLLSPTASQRRPSRKFTSMVDKMKRIDRALKEIKDQQHSERATLEELLSQAQDISVKARHNITMCQSIKNVLGHPRANPMNSHLRSTCSLPPFEEVEQNPEAIKSPGNSLAKGFSFNQDIKLPITPGNNSLQLKRLAFFKRNQSIEDLDRIIGQALEDLRKPKESKLRRQTRKAAVKKDLLVVSKKANVNVKQEETGKILVVFLAMVLVMVFIANI